MYSFSFFSIHCANKKGGSGLGLAALALAGGGSGSSSGGSGGMKAPTNILLSNRTINEEQAKGTVIGTLTTESSTNSEPYTYKLVAGTGSDNNADFIIDGAQIKSNKVFDFETKASYSIRIQTTDKNKQTFAKAFTITISDVDENIPPAISKWTAGWRNNKAQTATISGNQIEVDVTSADFLTEVTLAPASATISPDPNTVTDWSNEVTFTTKNAKNTKTYEVKVTVNTENFNHIDVGEVTNMKDLFKDKGNFNGDISKWNVSKVTNMSLLFYKVRVFNGDISKWDVSKVTNMQAMFYDGTDFNQDIGAWDVSKVTNMQEMFFSTRAFNQDIDSWDVSKVTNMNKMFAVATVFNQNIRNWNVAKVTNCTNFAASALVFDNNNRPTFTACTP